MRIKFSNIGRNNETWESVCDELTYEWLYKEVKPYLMSDTIDFTEDGKVIVGGFRVVGEFKIID